MDRQLDGQKDRQTDRQMDGQTDGQMDGQMDGQTEEEIYVGSHGSRQRKRTREINSFPERFTF